MDEQVEVYHTMVYHSSIDRIYVMHATTQINIQSIMLKKKSQPNKNDFLNYLIYMIFQKRQNYRDRNQIPGYRDWEDEETAKEQKELFEIVEVFYNLIVDFT